MSESVASDVAAGDDQDAGRGGRVAAGSRRPGARLLWAGGLLLAGLGLFTLYLFQSGVGPFNSDGASMILQAQAMLHGNPLLPGWRMADVSFYTTELPEYMLVMALRGLRPDVVHICGALTYTLTVLLAAFLARGRATGRAGAVRALLAGAIMLAPGITGGTEVFLENPDHAGTAVPILHPAAAAGPRAGTLARPGRRLPAAGLGPGRRPAHAHRGDRAGGRGGRGAAARAGGATPARAAEFRYDGLLLAAAVASVVLASLAEAVIRAARRLPGEPADVRAAGAGVADPGATRG